MTDTNAAQSAAEIAVQLEKWLESRERMRAAGEDIVHLDQQILPFKTKYVQNGAIYGANSAGMVRWFAEARPEASAPILAPATGAST